MDVLAGDAEDVEAVRNRGRLAVIAAAVVAGTKLALYLGSSHAAVGQAAPPLPTSSQATYSDATFNDARVQLLARAENAEGLAIRSPESYSRHADAAGYRLDYAQLTGDYDAYVAADRHIAGAFSAVERRGIPTESTGTGPFLLKAQIDYSLHRFGKVSEDLDPPERDATANHDAKLLAEVKALRGVATFGRGEYDAGLALLREAETLDKNPSHRQRLALALAKVGEDDEALRTLREAADSAATPRSKCWAFLQQGIIHLERGRRAEARERFEAARKAFPGFWLVDEHIAELDTLEGDLSAAKAMYTVLVQRTNDPEFVDALADLVADSAPDEAKQLRANADALYAERLAKLPEASYGHALEHFLHHGAPARAVEIAEKNRDLRGDGEARTRLAQAYFLAGRVVDARREMKAVLASRWVSSEAFATAAIVLRSGDAGEQRAADEAEKRGALRNPHALEQIRWLSARARG
jgi:tetratricopeptide (TPR) repeat protein